MSNPTRIINQGMCAYCGAVGEVTSDHVIPQCLWSGRVPKDAPVVDACQSCNSIWKSGNDSYLRDLLINDRGGKESPIVQKVLPKYTRSVLRNQSLMNRDFLDQGKVVLTQRASGFLIPSLVAEVAEKRTKEILSVMVRGLHHSYLGEPLPKEASFWIGRLRTKEQRDEISNDIASLSGAYHRGAGRCIGDGAVFSCAYVELVLHDHTTLWQLNFYRNVVFAVATNLLIREEISSE